MWSKLLNLFFIQMFLLQASAFASPRKYLSGGQLQEAVSALKKMNTNEQQKLYLSILPLINKDDLKMIEENDLFKTTLSSLTVEGKSLVFFIENEKAVITDIDLQKWTAKLNGKPFFLKKSVKEQLPVFIEGETKTSFLDFFIARAQAEDVPVPNSKLKIMGYLIAGTVLALAAVGVGVWAWVTPKKGTEAVTIEEVETPKIEEALANDCNKQKEEVKKGRIGEKIHQSSEFIKKIRDKIAMLDLTKEEAKKMNMLQQDMKWIDDSKSCYDEVIELVEKGSAMRDDSVRSPKEVPAKPGTKLSPTAVKQ